jgi:hypothetical protein
MMLASSMLNLIFHAHTIMQIIISNIPMCYAKHHNVIKLSLKSLFMLTSIIVLKISGRDTLRPLGIKLSPFANKVRNTKRHNAVLSRRWMNMTWRWIEFHCVGTQSHGLMLYTNVMAGYRYPNKSEPPSRLDDASNFVVTVGHRGLITLWLDNIMVVNDQSRVENQLWTSECVHDVEIICNAALIAFN